MDQDAFRVPWWEIGLFRDAITGEIARDWTNPLTGHTHEAARTFEEGPSGYTIRSRGDGIALTDAMQAFARLGKAELTVTEADRVCTRRPRKRSAPSPAATAFPISTRSQETTDMMRDSLRDLHPAASIVAVVTPGALHTMQSKRVVDNGTHRYFTTLAAAEAWLDEQDRPA